MPLTALAIQKLKTTGAAYRVADERGLFVFVTATGAKSFRWKYRKDGKEKLMTFGRYPDVSIATARERHAEARRLLTSGVDPMKERKAKKVTVKIAAGNSFASIAALWLGHWQPDKSPLHVDSTRRRIKANILPRLGQMPITEIEAPDIVAMAKAIDARGTGDLAKRALETTGQIFRYAISHGYARRNPAAEIKPGDILKPPRKVNFARVDAKDLPGLLRSIEIYEGTQVTRLALKLLALTFVRTAELIGARWDEIDFEARRWNIPASRMKIRKPHIVPLANQTVDVLSLLQELTGGGVLLFPGDRDPDKPMSNNTILMALKRMGYKGRQTGHGFRGIASTILHEQQFDHAHIEAQLAHSERNAVSASYNHALYLEPRIRMMQSWADFLEKNQRGGKLLPFRAGPRDDVKTTIPDSGKAIRQI
jgi:integrase